MLTAVTQSFFVRIGSRSTKPSNTVHVLREVDFTDKRGTAHGTAYCGAQVRSMMFPGATVQRNLCERCRKSGNRTGFTTRLKDSVQS